MSDNPIRPLQKNNYLITRLTIVDADGKPIPKPFPLAEGGNILRCIAEYVDGSTEFYEPYWTCPLRLKGGGVLLWDVYGHGRRASITVHASVRQERYSEVACWVFPPDEDRRRERVVDSTSFDYSAIDRLASGE